ncbi:hypothetical protein ACSFA3_20690 [Variovorax sp. RHLX14]|uniref:hypothetical protein n=1 Tax=Variovorax sp. RHLX14 TaxID=1259731 RepID=UPI003F464175
MHQHVRNLQLIDRGHEVLAEADFMDFQIKVRCVYDSERQCWVYHVFLVDDTGLRQVSNVPSALISSSRLGAVHRGLKFARTAIRSLESAEPQKTSGPESLKRLASLFDFQWFELPRRWHGRRRAAGLGMAVPSPVHRSPP